MSGQTIGKWYFECTLSAPPVGANVAFGVGTTTSDFTNMGANATVGALCYLVTGNIWANAVNSTKTLGARTNGQTIGCAVDLNTKKIWFKLVTGGGGNWNGDGTADPATNTNGVSIPIGMLVPFCTFGGTGGTAGNSLTANFGGTAFVGAVPSGFLAGWGPEAPGEYLLFGDTTNVLRRGLFIALGAGAYAITGTAATLIKSALRILNASTGVYALTGALTTQLERSRIHIAGAGSYALTGTAVTLRRGRAVAAAAGSYAVTGAATTVLRKAKTLVAGVGSYAITGTAVALRKGTSALVAGAGSYALSGTTANLLRGRVIVAGVGSYTLTGTAAQLKRGRIFVAGVSSYALTGSDVQLRKGAVRSLVANSGNYTLTGAATTNLLRSRRVVAGVSSYAITGTAATLRKGKQVIAAAGVYTLTGASTTLLKWPRKITMGAGNYAITGTAAILYKAGSQQITPAFYANPDSFFTHAVTAFQNISPNLFMDPDQFFTQAAVYKQFITPSLFMDPDVLPQHEVALLFGDTEIICVDYEDRRMGVTPEYRLMWHPEEDRTMEVRYTDEHMMVGPRGREC